MFRYSNLLPKIYQYGGCLWVSDHIMYDCDFYLFANYLVSHRIDPDGSIYTYCYLGIEFSFLLPTWKNSHTVVM